MTCKSITETECLCREKFYSRNNDINYDAHYYVLHSEYWNEEELSRSERRRVITKAKKIKTSYKKARRRDDKLLTKFYTSQIM